MTSGLNPRLPSLKVSHRCCVCRYFTECSICCLHVPTILGILDLLPIPVQSCWACFSLLDYFLQLYNLDV